jgi:hypothetical protein
MEETRCRYGLSGVLSKPWVVETGIFSMGIPLKAADGGRNGESLLSNPGWLPPLTP